MKNSKIFPFERNKYYYGKLLSVDDFNLEQKYFCNKNRMQHRYLNGIGIIAGMYVVDVDEQKISVEAGCALDPFGREIVISEPVIKKLSMIDGFEQCVQREESFLYLCIEYDEKEKDPVYNAAGNAGMDSNAQQMENNKIRESYRLFLTNQCPQNYGNHGTEIFEESKRIFSQKGITITQTVPKYTQAGQKMILTIEIETRQREYTAFSYRLKLNGFSFEKKSEITIDFNEMLYEKTGKYTMVYYLDAVHAGGIDASITADKDSFKLIIDGKQKNAHLEGSQMVKIVQGNIKEILVQDYFKNSIENMTKDSQSQYLYLAKIYLSNGGENYVIDHLESVPFQQYAGNNMLLMALSHLMDRELQQVKEKVEKIQGESDPKELGKGKKQGNDISHGVYDMHIGLNGTNGRHFYSVPIAHGLGLGHVSILLSLRTKKGESIGGDWDVFEDSEPKISMAAKLDEETGSFVIGIKLRETTLRESIPIYWTAIRDSEEVMDERLERRIMIKPGMLELGIRETAQLEVSTYNMEDQSVKWIVAENGGEVDGENLYTAPNETGVYEIVAQSIAYPDIRASLFAVVREKK